MVAASSARGEWSPQPPSAVTSHAKEAFFLALAARAITGAYNQSFSLRSMLTFAASCAIPVSMYSKLTYVKDLSAFPASRTAITTFVWTPASISFVFCLLDLANRRLGYTSVQRVWDVVSTAWVVWPSWWALVRMCAPQSSVVSNTRRLVAMCWLIYLSMAMPPAQQLSEHCQPTAMRPEAKAAAKEATCNSVSAAEVVVSAAVSPPQHAEIAAAAAAEQQQAKPAKSLAALLQPAAGETPQELQQTSTAGSVPARSKRPPRSRKKDPAAVIEYPELSDKRTTELRELFALFDKNQRGCLTHDDFMQIGKTLKGIRWTEAMAKHHSDRFREINTSGSGNLNEKEFLDFFKNAGMATISDVVFDSYIHEYHEAVRYTSPQKKMPTTRWNREL